MSALELKIPPALQLVVAGGLMWLISLITPDFELSQVARVLLYRLLTVFGGVLVVLGWWDFRKARTTVDPTKPGKASALVVSGVYRFTRNPMYLGFLFMLAGWAVYLTNAVSLLVIPGFIAYISRFQIEPEERALEEKFGSDYSEYSRRVRRWI